MTESNTTFYDKASKIAVFGALWVFGGVYGFIYEFIFYFLNSGAKSFYWRGGNFTPWILLYACGALLIYLFTFKFRSKPILVFLMGALCCGMLEYVTGLVLYKMCDGFRAWDYNMEKWNFGNIGGFICLRSVVVFGLSAMLLMYCIYPLIIKLKDRMGNKPFVILTIILVTINALDQLYNSIIAPQFTNLVKANDIYIRFGLKI